MVQAEIYSETSLHFRYNTRSYVKNDSNYYSCRWNKLKSDGLMVQIPLAIDYGISQLLIQHRCVCMFSTGEHASCQHCFESLISLITLYRYI